MRRLIPALCAAGALLAGCGPPGNPTARAIGDADRGRELIASVGCGACHLIPGVPGAKGAVGPPLQGVASRTIIAGVLPNTPENLIHWIEAPQGFVPGNAMPNLELTDHDARDIAAYLETLR
jgi:cytochrome c2